MKDFSVQSGVLIVCTVAITMQTIFALKHKQCVDRNSAIIEKMQDNDTDRETIQSRGYEINIGCRADTDFNLT